METYYYNVSYGSYEDSAQYALLSSKKFSESQFKKKVYEATAIVMMNLRDKKKVKYYGDYGERWKYLVERMNKCDCGESTTCNFHGIKTITFSDILEFVVEELIKTKLFRKIEYTSRWGCFGWPPILTNDWGKQRGSELNGLAKSIKWRMKK